MCKGTFRSYFLIIDTEHRYISQTTTKARPQFAGEEDDLQICRVAANVLNRQSLPLDGPLTYGLEKGLTPHCKEISILRSITQSIWFRNHWRSLVNKQINFSLHENARKFE